MFIALEVCIYYTINMPGLAITISKVICIQYTLILHIIPYTNIQVPNPYFYTQLNRNLTITKKFILVTTKYTYNIQTHQWFLNIVLLYKIRLCTNSQKRRFCQLTSVCSVLPFVYQWWYGNPCLCVTLWGPVQSDAVWLGPVWHFVLEYEMTSPIWAPNLRENLILYLSKHGDCSSKKCCLGGQGAVQVWRQS
jgi:hypothetical protein